MYANNKCCVRHGGQQSDWCAGKSGQRQGCTISPLLFLIAIDCVMKRATNQQPRETRWKAFNHLEDEDFVDDIALLSHQQKDMQEETSCVETTARSIGLKMSHSKTKVMNTKSHSNVFTDGKSVENVIDFKYLGSYLTADGNINREISGRIVMASTAFYKLNSIWKSNRITKDTKLKLYTSNVRSVLLYASETWRTNQRLKVRGGFEGWCLRGILGIRWQHRVTNKEISERTGIRPIVEEVKHRRWRWLRHVLRVSKSRHPLTALTWNPQGAGKKGRPQGTWRRSVESERVESGKTWNELNWLAQDRCEWRKFVGALCSQEDYG
ncbi:endonuclease-reverse transcriptase [Elysia marginata]|uniref:Endonuclease-reverse transcriptase n=1 Tax=Elysia marginata TaxID=1093978 RepID=A0AAV4H4N7_9GAST|nr:endonuclease-reverse transcriptase [Elysia marginata]